ncbi:hypothetical protein SAMN05216232_0621 [Virgibacillus subterraneus]|uniref:Uncharacterized protein n=2 Tax=Virgibacillus TaxID=84406 RepID=A0A1H0Y8N2_9BACI|nr:MULTISPECIES: hypothetical protein [Virgibacillus]SDQ11411.1 hypothetical protein SAMN05216231_0491 [Virgibacillus salinus]SEP69981.1 hypothetical protein SAMN05216232_0621 [Virgibacillus subterraneus]
MRKLLIVLFMVLILSFGIVGYTQSTDDTNNVVDEQNENKLIVN